LSVLAAAVIAMACAVALRAPASTASDGNRLEAVFIESNASITNRIGDLGVFQLINTGTGSVEGFGEATVMLGATQDRSVAPCGPGSWTNAAIRRIVLEDGVLVLRELVHICQTPSGPVGNGTWTVDGESSTGVFSDSQGSGHVTISVASSRAELSGKLKLANPNGS
jgi:hypothetical protein